MKRLTIVLCLFLLCTTFAQTQSLEQLKTSIDQKNDNEVKVEMLLEISKSLIDSIPKEAQDYAENGLTLSKKISYLEGEAKANILIGKSFVDLNRIKKGIRHLEKSLAWAENNAESELLIDLYLELSNDYNALKKYEKADFFIQKLLLIEKAEEDKKQIARIRLLEKRFQEKEHAVYAAELAILKSETEKDSALNLALEQEFELLRLEKIAAELETQLLVDEIKLMKKSKQLNQLIGFVILALSLIVVIWQYKRIQKAKEATEREKLEAKRLRKLVSGIAHEIKNPLNYVNNFAQSSEELTEELVEELEHFSVEIGLNNFKNLQEIIEDIKESVSFILGSGKRVDHIVNNMISKAQYLPRKAEMIGLNELLDEHSNHAKKGIMQDKTFIPVNFIKKLDPNIPATPIFPIEMGRVIVNLINNSIESINEKALTFEGDYHPKIELKSRLKGNEVCFSVWDNGAGISEETVSQIFNPFFSTKEKGGENSGLGLALSREIIEKDHGGEINVKSVEGEFAEFEIKLPMDFKASNIFSDSIDKEIIWN